MASLLRRRVGAVGLASAAAAVTAVALGGAADELSALSRHLSQVAQCSASRAWLVPPGPAGNRVVGRTRDGKPVVQRTLQHGSLTVQVLDWGATLRSVLLPDKRGDVGEVTLGFDELTPYTDGTSPYFGCVAGRNANRIAKGRFTLDGEDFALATNNGPNHLHGGDAGFDKKLWFCEAQSETSLTLALISEDGDQGYPGCVLARVTYSLPTPNQLRIEYAAITDEPTLVNLTNHTYWNLKDGGRSNVLHHQVELAADFYTPVDASSIPTGEVRFVKGAMDLRKPVEIGAKIKEADNGMGYDHNFVMRGVFGADGLQPVARVYEPSSGRWMTVRSDQPGVQFYTGNYLDGVKGRGGAPYRRHHGLCLETQKFPDAANKAHFPSTVLRPGEVYHHLTVHEFGASDAAPHGPF